MQSIKFENGRLFYLDQTELPIKEVWRECKNVKDGFFAVKKLRVRGAPLIGVFSAYCIYVHLKSLPSRKEPFLKGVTDALSYLNSCRPTAVNLSWALNRVGRAVSANKGKPPAEIKRVVLKEARAIHKEDVKLCRNIGDYGVNLISEGDKILTHCNAGLLATAGSGTALAVIYKARKVYKGIEVYADETRPLLQGARLTAWELRKNKVPVTVICDNAAASLMQKGEIDKIVVGADRIASNGDVANKIGTYSLAVLARCHGIPFYVAAPFSTFDLTLASGEDIPIEERSGDEVKKVLGKTVIAPEGARAYNPAFDVTPSGLITAIISDRGVITPPFKKNIAKIFRKP